jgi:long-chain acyl-CoA synthetase
LSSLVAALRAAADSSPCRVAVRAGTEELSYPDLLDAATRLGFRLQAAGVEPAGRVALALPSTAGYAVAYYATLMAGGVVVPLNPAGADASLAGRLRNARPGVAVVGKETPSAVEAAAAAGLPLVELTDLAEGTRSVDPHPVADDEPAMIAYKASDEEEPVGVVLSHGALAWSATAAAGVLGLSGDDTLGSHFPLFYPLGQTYGLGAAVAAGCTLAIPAEGTPSTLSPTAAGVTVFGTFPILAGQALGAEAGQDTSAIRTVFCSGGRNLTPRVRDRLATSLGCEILEGYGPPETSALGCAGRSGQPQVPGSMGPAVPGVDLAVVDGRGRTARHRKAGRLLARGPNVMSGYWDRPKATARAFDSGWLITGDKARKDADGNVYLLDGVVWTDPLRGRETGRGGLLRRGSRQR